MRAALIVWALLIVAACDGSSSPSSSDAGAELDGSSSSDAGAELDGSSSSDAGAETCIVSIGYVLDDAGPLAAAPVTVRRLEDGAELVGVWWVAFGDGGASQSYELAEAPTLAEAHELARASPQWRAITEPSAYDAGRRIRAGLVARGWEACP